MVNSVKKLRLRILSGPWRMNSSWTWILKKILKWSGNKYALAMQKLTPRKSTTPNTLTSLTMRRKVTSAKYSMSRKGRGKAYPQPKRSNNRSLCKRLWPSREWTTPTRSCPMTQIFMDVRMEATPHKVLSLPNDSIFENPEISPY